MIETVFAKTRLMERVVGDPRGGWRLPVVRRLILATVLFLLASLAVAASASAATSFTNTSPITIPNPGNASPYPSEINVRGLTGPITDISVTLHRFGHKFPSEVDIVLVSPDGLMGLWGRVLGLRQGVRDRRAASGTGRGSGELTPTGG